MLDQDKRHSGAGREDLEELAECVEAARGSAERDDRKRQPGPASPAFTTNAG